MARMAVLVPYKEMCEPAELLMGQYAHITRACVEYITTEYAETAARKLEAQDCDIIMARGLQSRKIKRAVKLPVIDIRVTAQELGGQIIDIREELNLERPKIGLIGFSNMFCDTTNFDRLFGIELHCYLIETETNTEEHIRAAVDQAVREGCQAIIGGDVACDRAEELGICYRFISSGSESLKAAFDIAERVCYAIDQEKSSNAEIDAMLNYSPNGIVQVDADGIVLRANRAAYNLLNQLPANLLGQNVLHVMPTLTQEMMNAALREGRESYTILMPVQGKETVANIAPILIEQRIAGAILTLQEGQRIHEMDSELRYELYMRGYVARYRFDDIPCESEQSRQTIELAKRISAYNAPVLLSGEAGCGKSIFAQCIHNAGLSKGNAFISLDCQAYQEDVLDTMLFGNYSARKDTPACMVEIARDGTLYLSHVDALTMGLQFKLLQLIRGSFIHNGSNRPNEAKVRIIAGTEVNLVTKVQEGDFRSDLYYALNVLNISFKPLRSQREDILNWVDFYLNHWQLQHKRMIHLTQGARNYLQKYDWPGNIHQIDSMCERIVLLTETRNVDEVFLRRQIEQLSPMILPETGQVVLYKDKKAAQLAQLLKKHNGNRQMVADELGISKTTLWRHMKKYGIDKDFSY